MSAKQDKKLRQLFRRDFQKQIIGTTDAVKAVLADMLKPKPWFVPEVVWNAARKLFIKV